MNKYFDLGSRLVILLTFALFIAALFTSGLTHNMFLEAGVLLVSVKLIMMNHKNSLSNQELLKKIDELKEMLSKKQ